MVKHVYIAGVGNACIGKHPLMRWGYCFVEESFLHGKSIFTLEGDCNESLPILKINL